MSEVLREHAPMSLLSPRPRREDQLVAGVLCTIGLHGVLMGLVIFATLRTHAAIDAHLEPKLLQFEDVELLALGEEKPPQALPRIANPPPPEVKPDVVDPTPNDTPVLQKPEVKPEPPPETPEEVRRKKMQDALSALHDPNRPVNEDTPAGSEAGVVGGTVSDAALAHLMNTYTARLIQALRERREAPSSLSEEEIAALDRKVAIYVRLSSEGHILSYQWVKRSGNDLYDDSLELTLKRFMLQYGGRTLPLPEQPEVREQVLLQGLRFTGM